jgi:hypothetical protein
MEFAADDFEAIAKAMKPSSYDLPKDQLPKEEQPYDWAKALHEAFVPYFNQPESD